MTEQDGDGARMDEMEEMMDTPDSLVRTWTKPPYPLLPPIPWEVCATRALDRALVLVHEADERQDQLRQAMAEYLDAELAAQTYRIRARAEAERRRMGQ